MFWYKKSILTYNLALPGVIGGFLVLAGLGIQYYFSDELATKQRAYDKFTQDDNLMRMRMMTFGKKQANETAWSALLAKNVADQYSADTQIQKLRERYGDLLAQGILSNPVTIPATPPKRPMGSTNFEVSYEGSWRSMQKEALQLEYRYPQLHLESAIITPSQDQQNKMDMLSFKLKYAGWQVLADSKNKK